ncbi:hypothetical protein S7711_08071 [Stachybotrys chartarum IBT 7711]|uniref:Endopolyphosphatase n=1 Tax=Stachybotrys chartarum (strain CBS 109288 / IBT 7711) TaxID=1280523 RepID=A0A084AHL3_STACB|nr:hypothetical protein S7711_08071 [Stachybotrys chartarum IBT 7711]
MPAAGKRRQLLALLALGAGVVAVPVLPSDAGADQQVLQPHPPQSQTRPLQGRFLHITDFHPDPYYKVRTSTEEGIACHRDKGLAGTYGAEKTDCDSPFSLVDATFDWLKHHVRDKVDFVVWTGDTARHDSDEKLPRHADEVIRTNRKVADKFFETFSSGKDRLAIPVVPSFGNNDFLPHNIFYPGPNKWLKTYSHVWERFIPEEQRHSFEFGGWFYVDVVPGKLAVFSLNTMYFFDRNAGVNGCAAPSEPGHKHFEWLRVQLQRMRESGMKAILMGHVPPARTGNKQNWDETCWQRYTLWLKQYRDVVVGAVYGHMNIDHFLLQDSWDVDITGQDDETQARESLESIVSIASKGDYLQDLRKGWSEIPGSVAQSLSDDEDDGDGETGLYGHKRKNKGSKDKFHKIGGEHAERYQVSLVSPSIVPNYFPTIRIIEYNITGLGHVTLWTDSFNATDIPPLSATPEIWEEDDAFHDQLKRSAMDELRKKKKKKKQGKKPKDPNLVIPDDPPAHAPPGPAYLAQPFTFTGYTQYYANLTYVNNDIADHGVEAGKWRSGDHGDDELKHGAPKPRKFKFEVEYSTFDDKIFKLPDLTVKNYVKLAYRIAKEEKKKRKKKKKHHKTGRKGGKTQVEDNDDDEDGYEYEIEDDDDFEEEDGEEDTAALDAGEESDDAGAADGSVEETRRGRRKTKNRRKKKSKVWLHFLRHAFVSTLSTEELEEL